MTGNLRYAFGKKRIQASTRMGGGGGKFEQAAHDPREKKPEGFCLNHRGIGPAPPFLSSPRVVCSYYKGTPEFHSILGGTAQ